MRIREGFEWLYPVYRLLATLTFGVIAYSYIPEKGYGPLLLVDVYLLVSALSFKVKNELFQMLALVADLGTAYAVSFWLGLPILVVFTLAPLFASRLLVSFHLAVLVLAAALVVDVALVEQFLFALVSHVSIFFASCLLYRESLMEEEKERQKRLQEEFREKLEIAKRLSREFAHEVKNPMSNIYAAVQMLRMRGLPKDCEGFVEVIEREVERVSRLASDFLRLESEVERLEEFDLCEMLRTLRSRFPHIDVRVRCGGFLVRGDREKLERAFSNMIQNSVEAGASWVRIDVERKEDRLRIEISDDGPGVDPEIRERVFMPFFTTKSSGTGLGLAIVKGILEKHGGSVRVKDRNTFELELPCHGREDSCS